LNSSLDDQPITRISENSGYDGSYYTDWDTNTLYWIERDPLTVKMGPIDRLGEDITVFSTAIDFDKPQEVKGDCILFDCTIIRDDWVFLNKSERKLISFHSSPSAYFSKLDPTHRSAYVLECNLTTDDCSLLKVNLDTLEKTVILNSYWIEILSVNEELHTLQLLVEFKNSTALDHF
jgi:hypothetical protein